MLFAPFYQPDPHVSCPKFNANLSRPVLGAIANTTVLATYQVVGGVDGGATLHSHVEHLHVVEDHQDVRHRVAVRVLVENEPLSPM